MVVRINADRSSFWFLLLIGFTGFISSQVGNTLIATFCLGYIYFCLYKVFEFKYEGLTAVALVFVLLISESSALYLFGQYVSVFPKPIFSLVAYFVNISICIYFENYFEISKQRFFKLPPVILAMLLKVVYLLPVSEVIRFLGFGYDNYGHLAVIRKLLHEGKYFYAENTPVDIPSFASSAPIGIHAVFAFLMQTAGLNAVDYQDFLNFYLFLFLTCVILFVLVLFKLATSGIESQLRKIAVLGLIFACIGYAYPSHIWVSGYLASNMATFLLLVAVGVTTSRDNPLLRVWLLAALLGLSLFIYSIFSILVIVPFTVYVSSNFKLILRSIGEISWMHRVILITSQLYFVLLAAISIHALRQGYGTSHFLVPGGIQPLPAGIAMFILGMSLILMTSTQSINSEFKAAAFSLAVMICVVCASILYAYVKLNEVGEQWALPYYPTKLAIAVLILAITFLVRYLFTRDEVVKQNVVIGYFRKSIVLAILAVLVVGTRDGSPFNRGFMGSTNGVIESIRDSLTEVVNGRSVEFALDYALPRQKPVLYLSDMHDSELNTRWINSLLFQWNDENWNAWRKARSAIEVGDFTEAAELLNGKFLVFLDDYSNFINNPIPFKELSDICVLDVIRPNGCRLSSES